MQLQRIAHVDVLVVAPAPMKSLALFALYSFDVDVAPFEKLQVVIGKIIADDADDPDRRKKTRRQGKIRRRTAENPLRRARWRFDGIEGDGSYDQYTHRYFPIIGFSLARTCLGMRAGSVIIAFFNAEAQEQAGEVGGTRAIRRTVFCARATFWVKTARTCSISTSAAA